MAVIDPFPAQRDSWLWRTNFEGLREALHWAGYKVVPKNLSSAVDIDCLREQGFSFSHDMSEQDYAAATGALLLHRYSNLTCVTFADMYRNKYRILVHLLSLHGFEVAEDSIGFLNLEETRTSGTLQTQQEMTDFHRASFKHPLKADAFGKHDDWALWMTNTLTLIEALAWLGYHVTRAGDGRIEFDNLRKQGIVLTSDVNGSAYRCFVRTLYPDVPRKLSNKACEGLFYWNKYRLLRAAFAYHGFNIVEGENGSFNWPAMKENGVVPNQGLVSHA